MRYQKEYDVELSPEAKKQLDSLPDPIKAIAKSKLARFAAHPKGKRLIGKLTGVKSFRFADNKYRIIWVMKPQNLVFVLHIGKRDANTYPESVEGFKLH